MKPNYSTLLLLAAASLFGTMSSHAGPYKATIESTPVWSQTTDTPSWVDARTMTASGGYMYLVEKSKKLVYYTNGNGWKTFSMPTSSKPSFFLTTDDTGTIVLAFEPSFAWSTSGYDMKFVLLNPGSTNLDSAKDPYGDYVYITIPGNSFGSSRMDLMSASGDLRSAAGGYLYFYPMGGTDAGKLIRAKVANSAYTGELELYTGGIAPKAYQALAKAVKDTEGNDQVLLQTGSQNNVAKLYSINTTNKTLTLVDDNPYSSRFVSGTKVTSPVYGEYYVYPGYEGSGYSVTKTTLNIKSVKTGKVSTVTVDNTSWTVTAGIGMIVEAKFDDASNPNVIHAYCYILGKGVWKYKINVTKSDLPAPNASAQVVVLEGDSEAPGRQDAVITWDAIEGAESYRVERKLSTAADNAWSVIADNLTGTTYTNSNILNSYNYRVIASEAKGDSDPSATLLCEAAFIPHIPEWDALRVYNGYAKTQALWNYSYGFKPDAYDVIRDGVVIAKDITVMNYIDTYIPAGTRNYEIASVYYTDEATKTRRPESARSAIKTVEIVTRNPTNELYGITELYNYEITETSPFASMTAAPNFHDQDLYRQAAFYNGKWYVAQRKEEDDFSTRDLKGGIVCFDADVESQEALIASAKKIYELEGNTNVGIAVDDNGTFFIKDDDGDATPTSFWEYTHPIKKGRLLKFNEDASGNFTVANDVSINLSGVADGSNTIKTRADYYSMKGDVLNGSGKLYLAPSSGSGNDGKDAWIINITNGAVTSSKCYNSHVDTSTGGQENFAFPLNNRDDVMHLVRSNGYFRLDPANTANSNRLYDTMSRINNAGGASIWFNNDFLLITPQSKSSKNIGDFFVAKGTPDPAKLATGATKATDAKDVLIEADKMIPIVAVTQEKTDQTDVENTNGMWFGLEPHYNAAGAAEYLDIYLYVPAIRFAKYRLYPYLNLPGPGVRMDVDIQYEANDEGDNVDITSFKGTATWDPITASGDVSLKSYDLKFMSMDNTVLAEHWFDQDGNKLDADGNKLTTDGSGITDGKFSCSIDNLDSREYQAQLTANFESNNDGRTWVSEPSVASDQTDYEPIAPIGTIRIVIENKVWPDAEGKNRRNHRLDIDFNAPDFSATGDSYPVSYYELWYNKPGDEAGTYPNRIDGFFLMNGTKRAIRDQNEVPGTFDFENTKAQAVRNEGTEIVCYYYAQPEVDADGMLVNENDDPAKWKVVVRAKYAARAANCAIAKDRQSVLTTQTGGTTGAGEIVAEAGNTTVYPTLTNGPLTIKSHEPIETVTVHGVDGSLVMTFAGNSDQILKIDLSNLQSGLYIVNVNGDSSHKIVKR